MTYKECLMCNNCEEIYKKTLDIYGNNNFLFQTDNFIANIDSFPIATNHILIITKHHFTSFSNIDINKSDELQNIIYKILSIFNTDNYVMFEHGTNIVSNNNKICGNSIFHAHLHIIPNINIDIDEIKKKLNLKAGKSLENYSVNKNNKNFLNVLKYDLPTDNNYLLFSNNSKYYCIQEYDILEEIESQFFRKIISNTTNNGVYNWKDKEDFKINFNIYKSNFLKTVENYKKLQNHIDTKNKKTKLVRDNIINIIKNEGRNVDFYIANNDEEYMYFLKKKLFEECNEFIESLSIDKNNIIEECADVLEVIENILSINNITFEEVFKEKNNKNIKNGSFKNRYILL